MITITSERLLWHEFALLRLWNIPEQRKRLHLPVRCWPVLLFCWSCCETLACCRYCCYRTGRWRLHACTISTLDLVTRTHPFNATHTPTLCNAHTSTSCEAHTPTPHVEHICCTPTSMCHTHPRIDKSATANLAFPTQVMTGKTCQDEMSRYRVERPQRTSRFLLLHRHIDHSSRTCLTRAFFSVIAPPLPSPFLLYLALFSLVVAPRRGGRARKTRNPGSVPTITGQGKSTMRGGGRWRESVGVRQVGARRI